LDREDHSCKDDLEFSSTLPDLEGESEDERKKFKKQSDNSHSVSTNDASSEETKFIGKRKARKSGEESGNKRQKTN
jgi:hypothetical protein